MTTWERVKAVNVTACTEKATSFAATGIICVKRYWIDVSFSPEQYNFDTPALVFTCYQTWSPVCIFDHHFSSYIIITNNIKKMIFEYLPQ